MWLGVYYGEICMYGMNVNVGESWIGVEILVCFICYCINDNFVIDLYVLLCVGFDWQLLLVEFEWFGKLFVEICVQMLDFDCNGGCDWMGLVEYLIDDVGYLGFVLWGW